MTSIRARSLARDWPRHVWMLQRTIASMLAADNTEVIVVGHDPPELPPDPRVSVLMVDLPIPARHNDAMCIDKVLKVSAGIAAMQRRGADYIGICDADDLVSRRVSRFVHDHAGAAGWFSPIMLTYAYGGRWLKRRVMPPNEAGPFAVIRADLLHFEEPPFTGSWVGLARAGGESSYVDALAGCRRPVCSIVAAGHTRYLRLLAEGGHHLEPLPFNGHLMINHADSTSTVEGGKGTSQLPSFAQIARGMRRWLPALRPLTPSLRGDFGIPVDIPRQYADASVLWR
ncbi:MAG: hypothetical protein ACRD1W_17335 [Vicinamibacterales bacterium]